MRKCWNCGQPTNDETSRVCSDEICQRAEKKSSDGKFRNKELVKLHERRRERARKYNQRPESKAKMREYQQLPEIKERERKRRQNPEYKAKARERYLRNKKLREEE